MAPCFFLREAVPMNRRKFLKSALQTLAVGVPLVSAIEAFGSEDRPGRSLETARPSPIAPKAPLILSYGRPAADWLEAQPIGNGRLAGMVFGGIELDTLQLNEGSIWSGGPHDYDNPNALASLSQIRRLVFAEEWAKAEDLINAQFLGRPANQSSYQPVGRLELSFPIQSPVEDYSRVLDLDTAIVTTTFRANGVRFMREAFASFPDQVIVLRLSADRPESISVAAALKSEQDSVVSIEQPDTLVLAGVCGKTDSGPGLERFRACAQVRNHGGQIQAEADQISVAGADSVTIFISMASGYLSYNDISGDPALAARRPLNAVSGKSYEELRRAHLGDYQPKFHRVSLNLGEVPAGARTTEERIKSFAVDHDPSLLALYSQFGRYLLLSCSRPGGAPASLQGLWNDSLTPPWGSKYTININTEMNYWPAGPGNLLECYEPLFDMIRDLSQTGAHTAKRYYGAGGWVCHHNTDGWRGAAPVDGAFWGMWPTGGAWLCLSLWEYYEYTGDRDTLRQHYPLMKGAAEFFLDSLVEEPTHGWLVTCPSVSPENAHHSNPDVSVCAGPTMDLEILRDLFDACSKSAELLDVDQEFRQRIGVARTRLAPLQIGKIGQLQEWLQDWDADAPEIHHRHLSHLYGVYPGSLITPLRTPNLFAAARKSLEMRGDESAGWAAAWRAALWARFGDGDHALRLLSQMLAPGGVAANLFNIWSVFQIDGNFGATAAVFELLLQSHEGAVHLLPALPTAWPSGSVRGLRARGGYEVGIAWDNGTLQAATIHALHEGTCTVRLGNQTNGFSTRAGHVYEIDSRLQVVGEKAV